MFCFLAFFLIGAVKRPPLDSLLGSSGLCHALGLGVEQVLYHGRLKIRNRITIPEGKTKQSFWRLHPDWGCYPRLSSPL